MLSIVSKGERLYAIFKGSQRSQAGSPSKPWDGSKVATYQGLRYRPSWGFL